MRVTLRTKLLLIVGVTALTLLTTLVINRLISQGQIRNLVDMEARIVPRLSLGPKIEVEFEHLRQELQNAVAAQDQTALNATIARKDTLLKLVSTNGTAISAQDSALLRHVIGDYYSSAEDVSRRLISGETGETLGADIQAMHTKQALVETTIKQATVVGHDELAHAFDTIRQANERISYYRIVLGLCGLMLVLLISNWAGRSLLRSVGDLSLGFSRFGTGSFSQPIVVSTQDELADIARAANKMAANLDQLNVERERNDWLKESLASLSDELRGDLQPNEVTRRALHFLCDRIKAMVGTFHIADDAGVFSLSSHYGVASDSANLSNTSVQVSFRLNEGLPGRAAVNDQILLLPDPPPDYLKVRSSLGDTAPRALLFVPLHHLGKPVGLLEFALLGPCSDQVHELLESMRSALAIALQAARGGAELRDLLARTQAQAERLIAQEEELRVNNQELESQQDVLRTANEELEAQRRVLSERNDELEQARKGLQEKAAELLRMSSYKSQFLANMSHELRTPLNSMLILSHLLAENEGGRLTEKQVEHARTVHSAGKDLLQLINQVLDLAKIEAGRQEIHVETVELASIVAHVRRVFEPLAAEKKLRLVVNLALDAPDTIDTDRQRLERILTNLLGNAIKFTDQGSVTLSIQRPERGAHLERTDLDVARCVAFVVSDTGIGIAESSLDKVFAPFEQIDSGPDRRHTGTGLGLAISRESVNLIGGELRLSSSEGKGSTFTCYLPERIQQPLAPGRPPSEPPPARAQASQSTLHVLLIVDDPVLAEQLVDIVQARHLSVLVARTGHEGLALAREQRPRGIILDVKLPDMDGWAVMDRLRKDPATSGIPVHFISATDSPQRAFALGAIGYLTKPVSSDELVSVVRLLVPGTGETPRILVVEDNAHEGASLMALLGREQVEVLHVQNAHEALEALEKQTFGCMILDLGLPDMDGLGLLETLRSRTHIQWPRVVVHTGRALTKKETHALQAYAEAIVLKDGSSAERLVEEVRLFVRHLNKLEPNQTHLDGLQAPFDLSLKGCKLLLAEDDMRTVYAISALLRSKGAAVIVAETGREALDLLDKNKDVAAVLMDVMMPEMDGYEAMRQIRLNPIFKELPVIALTAKAMKGERERCLEAGASDYLAKPVDGDRLLGTLAKWLRPGNEPDAGRAS